MTRVLVTGADGQVGRSIADRQADPRFEHLSLILCTCRSLDVTDPSSIERAMGEFRPDVIVNAAAFTAVDGAEHDEATATTVNADAVAALATACTDHDVRLVHLSTDYVFDGTKSGWYVESDPIAPLGVYGNSKATGEEAARLRTDHLILRTAWLFGRHGHNFVKTMLRLGTERTELAVVSDQVGCPTSTHDLADAILRLVDHDLTGTFHLAGSEEASWHRFASAIFTCADLPVAVEAISTAEFPTPALRPCNSRLDSTALETATGIRLPGWRAALPPVVDAIMNTDSSGSDA